MAGSNPSDSLVYNNLGIANAKFWDSMKRKSIFSSPPQFSLSPISIGFKRLSWWLVWKVRYFFVPSHFPFTIFKRGFVKLIQSHCTERVEVLSIANSKVSEIGRTYNKHCVAVKCTAAYSEEIWEVMSSNPSPHCFDLATIFEEFLEKKAGFEPVISFKPSCLRVKKLS